MSVYSLAKVVQFCCAKSRKFLTTGSERTTSDPIQVLRVLRDRILRTIVPLVRSLTTKFVETTCKSSAVFDNEHFVIVHVGHRYCEKFRFKVTLL